MDLNSRLLMLGSGGTPSATLPTHFYSTIDAVNGSATGIGSYTGSTGTISQSTYRHGSFSSSVSAAWEWQIDFGFSDSCGFIGLMDLTHWNAGPSYSSTSGERMMWYVGNSFSGGEATGTSIVQTNGTGAETTFATNDILGLTYNRANGKLAYYKNGSLFLVQQNTATTSLALYPSVSYWTSSMGTTMRTAQSAYFSNYALIA